MSKRHKISRRASKRNFRNHSGSNPLNYAPMLMRGGFRI